MLAPSLSTEAWFVSCYNKQSDSWIGLKVVLCEALCNRAEAQCSVASCSHMLGMRTHFLDQSLHDAWVVVSLLKRVLWRHNGLGVKETRVDRNRHFTFDTLWASGRRRSSNVCELLSKFVKNRRFCAMVWRVICQQAQPMWSLTFETKTKFWCQRCQTYTTCMTFIYIHLTYTTCGL